jgi:hypothetical protein
MEESVKLEFFLVFFLLALCALAQEPAQPVVVTGKSVLTNDSIITMVKGGLAEDVIISVVNTQHANYTLTPEQLIALKTAGVPDRVVKAMVDKYSGPGVNALFLGKASGATPATGTISTGDPNNPLTPHDSGIYLYAKNQRGEYTLSRRLE